MPGGMDALYHALEAALEDDETLLLLVTDITNACNSMSRGRILQLVIEHFPDLAPCVWSCHGEAMWQWVRMPDGSWRPIMSYEGVLQGDPLAPMLFTLGFMLVMAALLLVMPELDAPKILA